MGSVRLVVLAGISIVLSFGAQQVEAQEIEEDSGLTVYYDGPFEWMDHNKLPIGFKFLDDKWSDRFAAAVLHGIGGTVQLTASAITLAVIRRRAEICSQNPPCWNEGPNGILIIHQWLPGAVAMLIALFEGIQVEQERNKQEMLWEDRMFYHRSQARFRFGPGYMVVRF